MTRTTVWYSALLLAALGCSTGPADSGTGGTTGMPGKAGHGGPGMMGAAGTVGTTGQGGLTGVGGAAGATFTCVPGVEQVVITDCGYPMTGGTALASVVFNEDGVFRAIQPAGGWPNGIVRVFYNDEHALTLGVRSVVVKSASGTTTTDFPVSALTTDPGSVTNPLVGTTMLSGSQSGLDASLRPMWPVLYITDVTADPTSRAGDWQQGGRPYTPNAVFGSWKAAVRTVDQTVNPATVTIAPDADPAKNDWNLAGGDPAPSGLANEGYGAEVRWEVPLTPGRSYRIQAIVHDGDQNKVGGDSGEGCVLFCAGGSCPVEGCDTHTTGTAGTGGGGYTCPNEGQSCGYAGAAACPSGTTCANGCCLIGGVG
jgi:hypothetical protein